MVAKEKALGMKRLSHYLGFMLSITLFANSTIILGAEQKKGRLAHAWSATKAYTEKAAKRIGLDKATYQAKNTVKKYAKRAQDSLTKFVACLEGKETCSKEDVRKARLYTAVVITAVAILTAGMGYKIWQKRKRKEEERPREQERTKQVSPGKLEAEEPTPQEYLAEETEKIWVGHFEHELGYFMKKNEKINWTSASGKKINNWLIRQWEFLSDETKYSLKKLDFNINTAKLQ